MCYIVAWKEVSLINKQVKGHTLSNLVDAVHHSAEHPYCPSCNTQPASRAPRPSQSHDPDAVPPELARLLRQGGYVNDGESIEQAAFRVLSERLNQEKSLLRKLEGLGCCLPEGTSVSTFAIGFLKRAVRIIELKGELFFRLPKRAPLYFRLQRTEEEKDSTC